MIEYALALSLHLGLEGNYNGVHPHIRYNEQNYIAGVYYNSERNISTYLGKRWEYNTVGIEAGAVIGYTNANILPYVRITYNDWFMAPGVEPDNVGLVVGYEFKW